MVDQASLTSRAFQTFTGEAPAHAEAWMTAVSALGAASALASKTGHLAYLAVLAAARLHDGLPFHVTLAKQAGASRAEIASAILVGLPAVGNAVVSALPVALQAFDAA
ncbi:carboxymuconolactone decarboxylase family protein [Labrys monachus]|uniref:Alkylhydroperoxidase/carboxymuconolactone decarboxylase family protein YurZ n=1 Tax=Labrys monachus TaxID=217067 RepID=A0ABU0F8V6_9HYPH|nr:carboxymuconolactone decarboxylase family protein [Labrys monachus]MDQ0390584.1 alkylhydroperoxidase/carboxymuconolactone decarboxylase family protein YurZ [Labrys monachus]